jgi:hypothetical protein
MNVYVIGNFRTPILVNLKQVIEGCITNNLMTMNRNYVKMFGGLSNNDMSRKAICDLIV